MAIKDNSKRNSIEKLMSCIDDLQNLPLDELRAIRRELGHDVEGSEQRFLALIGEMNSQLVGYKQIDQSAQTADLIMTTEPPIRGLLAEAKALSLSIQQMVDMTNLSIALVIKLNLRLIRFASIPPQVIEDLANVLRCSVGRIAAYLQGSPLLPEDAYFKADEMPTVPDPQDFFEEVRTDNSLSEERRQRLLRMVP